MASIKLRPTDGTGSNWKNIGNAYDGNESTNASVSVSLFSSPRTLTLNFDTSVIPSGATINSATLTMRSKAGKNTISAYVDINGDSQHRVINQKQPTNKATNYTADVTNYMSDLTSVNVVVNNNNWSGNTFDLHELWIDVDYTASTTSTTYTVRFLDWDNSVISTQTVTRGGSATPPSNPTRVGYDFTGWSGGSYTNVTSNVVLTAQYSIKTFTVRFLDWNNDVLDTQTVDYGGSATPPNNPTRDGYTFTGWSGNYTNVTADVDIKAQYTKNSSGGEVDTSVKNIKIGHSTISKLYLGTSQIVKVYLGDTLLYSNSTGGGSSSKNLFNKATAKLNYKMKNPEIGGEIVYVEDSSYFCSDYIKVKPDTKYILSQDGSMASHDGIAFLDENKKVLDFSESNPFTTSTGTKYIVLCDRMDNIDIIQIEEGNIVTDYEPY